MVASVLSVPCEELDAFISSLDAKDELSEFRDRFHTPILSGGGGEKGCGKEDANGSSVRKKVYLCGNSLGLMPKATESRLTKHLDTWAKEAVGGHFIGDEAWLSIEDLASSKSLDIVGAKSDLEVVYMNTLTVNIHLMMVAFYRPEGRRRKILIEEKAFPSDDYAVQSQVRFHGYDPEDCIVRLAPRAGEATFRTADILESIEARQDELALIFLPGVQFYSGQVLPMAEISALAGRLEIPVGFDLAHAVGNVELSLHDWQVDFAVWCSYKYLNSGPGAVSGVFLHERHAHNDALPRFAGWWGYDRSSRFKMKQNFVAQPGAYGFQLSNPPVLATVPVACSLEIFAEAGMPRLRAKSERLSDLLEGLLDRLLAKDAKLITPRDPTQRGCQLSIQLLRADLKFVHAQLEERGIICDTREPDVMRVAPTPLYNTFADVLAFVRALVEIVNENQATDSGSPPDR